jgi:predicted acetyltransferase
MRIKNLERLKKLYFDGFPEDSEKDAADFFKRVKNSNCVYLEENGEITSGGYIIEKPAVIFGKRTKLRFLSALATKKELRGSGRIGTVLKKIFELLRSRGEFFCALYPFSHRYYLRHGFCTVSFCDETEERIGNRKVKDFADNYLIKPGKEFFKGRDFSGNEKEYVMGRIIDAKTALLNAPYEPGFCGSKTFTITDGIIPENNVTLTVALQPGRPPSVAPAPEKAGKNITIADLTALLFLGDGEFIRKQKNVFPDRW